MKNLKLLFSLSLACFLIFTACRKDLELDTVTQDTELQAPVKQEVATKNILLFLPEGVANNAEKTMTFYNTLTEEEHNQHALTFKILHFLKATNNLESLERDKPEFTLLTMADVEKYAPNEIDTFEDFNVEDNMNTASVRANCSDPISYCDGLDLVTYQECCSGFWIWKKCWIQGTIQGNHSSCLPPPPPPSCVPPCPPNMVCAGGTCIPL